MADTTTDAQNGHNSRRVSLAAFSAAFLVLAALVAIFWRACQFGPYPIVHHDIALNFIGGRALLQGKTLYVDWIDNNPPAIYFLSAGISALADGLPSREGFFYYSLVCLLGLWGCLIIARATRFLHDQSSQAIVLLAYVWVVSGCMVSPFEFGQREHFFLILFLPYLVLMLQPRRRGPFTPMFAALGYAAAFKPQFAVAVIIVELFLRQQTTVWATRFRWLILGLGFATPWIILSISGSEAWHGFYQSVVQYYWQGLDAPYRENPDWFFRIDSPLQAVSKSLMALSAVALTWGALRQRAHRRLHLLFLTLLAWAIASIFLQGKYYEYHFFLASGLSLFLWMLSFSLRRKGESPAAIRPALCLCILMGMIANNMSGLILAFLYSDPSGSVVATEKIQPAATGLMISTSAEDVLPFFHRRFKAVGPWGVHLDLANACDDFRHGDSTSLAVYGKKLQTVIDQEKPDVILFSPNNQTLRPFHRYTFPAMAPPILRNRFLALEAYSNRMVDTDQGTWLVFERK